MADLPLEADVVIVGAGPAGLSAAAELRRRGVARVLVLDREGEAGGIPRHCGHYPYGLREFRRLMRGPDYARRIAAEARSAGADVRTGVTVLSLEPGPALTVSTTDGVARITAEAVLLATGVREGSRAERLIGGTKPAGVLSTGALQGLVYLDGLRPFRRPVILGTELVSFSAILTCRHAGIRPAAMVEPGPRAVARWPAALFPRLLGIPVHYRTEIAAIEGEGRVTGVLLRGPGGATRRIAADGVIVSGRFRPEATLLRTSHLALDTRTGGPLVDQYGRLSDPAFFAAGNLLRPVETAGACWAEGRAVGRAIAEALAGRLPSADNAAEVRADAPALRFVLPQRIAETGESDPPPALGRLQVRLAEPVRGHLVLRREGDGAMLAGHRISGRPERRLSLPLPPADGIGARVRIEDGHAGGQGGGHQAEEHGENGASQP